MKKLVLTFLLTILSINLFASDVYEQPMSVYRDNYFIAGDKDDQVKFQISAKFNLLYPANTGIYFGYTQRSLWYLYESSSPFVETNFMPEGFYRLDSKNNIFGDADLGVIDFIQLSPIFHMSNGKDGLDSRGMNTYYGQIQLSVGDVYNFGVGARVWGWWNKSSKNKDIEKYISHYEGDIFFKLKSANVLFMDKEELHFKFGGIDRSDWKSWKDDADGKIYGWYSVELQIRILTTIVQPYFFVQWYHGYAEWMVSYNEKEKSLRAGFIFK